VFLQYLLEVMQLQSPNRLYNPRAEALLTESDPVALGRDD
jgi:hypothetical protein